MKTKSATVLLGMVAVLTACGGMVAPSPEACSTELGPFSCEEQDFYTFHDVDGQTSVGDQCKNTGCPRGDRCAVQTADGLKYGVCR